MLLSKSIFDLDHSNNPILKLEIKSSPDVRDKIARRFIEGLGNTSQWLEIYPNGEGEYIVYPVTPERLRDQAKYMIARADELERKTTNYAQLVEGDK